MIIVHCKSLDPSVPCSGCGAAMYWLEGDQDGMDISYHTCEHCSHVSGRDAPSCSCESCTLLDRQIQIRETLSEEKQHAAAQQQQFEQVVAATELAAICLTRKLFLLALLQQVVGDERTHNEYIDLKRLNMAHVSPSYLMGRQIIRDLKFDLVLLPKPYNLDLSLHFIHVGVDGYNGPSLTTIHKKLQDWFSFDLSKGLPFSSVDEAKRVFFEVMAHEAMGYSERQFTMLNFRFSGTQKLIENYARYLEVWSPYQLFSQIQTAVKYLHKANILAQTHENRFFNANHLAKTLEQYFNNAQKNKWEIVPLKHPPEFFSSMTRIFVFDFLKLDQRVFGKVLWKSWEDIHVKMKFFTTCYCSSCGGRHLEMVNSDNNSVSLNCLDCRVLGHYFL